ncbi:docking protein 2 isoform X2 [Anoplophora glabripennis]|uniref:docking protein 2 isoform X2 n=1 Tax=Anoplophora glabripennis TaxID=217634 RepID=UPI000873E532|nr:docking protein 2 isoform X2 [Anoplophora glabripennis]
MEQEEAIYKGFLLLPPVGKLLKKSWQQKHCLLFKASKFGIERLEIYDAADSKESKILTLENCIKVHAKSATIFCITTKTAIHEFATLTEQSLNEWLSAIQSVAFPEEGSRLTSIEEDNDLYCSSGEGVFNVKLHHSPASQRCGLENKHYTLVLTSTSLQLRNIKDDKLLFTWPYCYIRRYGYKTGKFTFEAGRKCESGEGTFFLEHPNQQEIFRCLATKMKSMKKLLSGETSPVLDCGDLQLQAALSMEARSRTPLPPSPTSQLIQDPNFKSQLSLPDLDQALKKTKPAKPPRKGVIPKKPFSSPTPSNNYVYETVGKYDDIEYRSDAWRTLGVDEPNHTEQVNEDDEQEDYMSWGQFKKEVENIKPPVQPVAPKIITGSTTDLDDSYYDKLNFFGSTSKLSTKSGYKQVLPIPVAATPYQPSFNEYDEVQCLDMEPVRPADDSHLGYALVRKEPGKEGLKEVVSDDKKKKEKDKDSAEFYPGIEI